MTLFVPYAIFPPQMASSLAKAQRHLELEMLIRKRLTLKQIAVQLGVSVKTVKRDLVERRESMLAEIGGEQAVIRDSLLRDAFLDHDALGQMIKHAEQNGQSSTMVVSDFYRNRATIRRDVARMIGAEQPARHLHLHANTRSQNAAQTVGPIQIVYGPPTYPNDNSEKEIVIDLPQAPDDRANCDPGTIRLAEELSRLKNQNRFRTLSGSSGL